MKKLKRSIPTGNILFTSLHVFKQICPSKANGGRCYLKPKENTVDKYLKKACVSVSVHFIIFLCDAPRQILQKMDGFFTKF